MKKLLIVVDYQHDFIDGTLGFPTASSIYPYINKLIHDYQVSGQDIVFTRDTHLENYLMTEEGKNLPIAHCIKATKGHRFYHELESLSETYPVFEKSTFGSSALLKYLESKDYEEITLVGLVTHICIISNAVIAKAGLPQAHIVVETKGVASFDAELEKKALDVLIGLHVELR